MTDEDDAIGRIERIAAELVPALAERLRANGLGEIEVVHGDLRLRIAQSNPAPTSPVPATEVSSASQETHGSGHRSGVEATRSLGVSSPAVGFFVYADGLGPGLAVGKGDAIGHVEMLGVRHDVRVPRSGTVRHLVAESGEAVEYGQVVVELEAAETAGR